MNRKRAVLSWRRPPVSQLLPLLMAFFFVLLQHGPRRHLFGPLAVASRPLCILLDMLVLSLFFRSDPTKMLLSRHGKVPPLSACFYFTPTWPVAAIERMHASNL
jgi:hypothetical protein